MTCVATKQGITTFLFSPLSIVAVFGSGIRDGKKSGSGINIPDPQHCCVVTCISASGKRTPYLSLYQHQANRSLTVLHVCHLYISNRQTEPYCSLLVNMYISIRQIKTLLQSISASGKSHCYLVILPVTEIKSVPLPVWICITDRILCSGGQIFTFIPSTQIFDFYPIGRLPHLHFFLKVELKVNACYLRFSVR